ncbi:uncharacterized protein LOC142984177 [Anticarsia gemmatalis]|uniref:uncharacterized protein LOC142984177 n=1 Tax=Anticarsia gemmatalis TaxID=129554 RepID=UPI003F765FA5
MNIFYVGVFASMFYSALSAPQQADSQLEITDPVTQYPELNEGTVKVVEENIRISKKRGNLNAEGIPEDESLSVKVYRIITEPIIHVIRTPKVNAVLRNIGTCVVNGALELFSFYLPAPFMPLVASAAGLVIPFEPVVMLKEKMPVTSYRRAFKTAMNTFLGAFDRYKMEDEFDPYMTRRFNRRFMDDDKKNDKEDSNNQM